MKDIYIVGINRSHNSSVALLKNNEVIFNIENERLSNIKYDRNAFLAINLIKNYTDRVDYIALSGMYPSFPLDKSSDLDAYSRQILGLGKTFKNNAPEIYDIWSIHHKLHAATAFYNSGFSEALCITKDGVGSEVDLSEFGMNGLVGRENGTSFVASYPNNFDIVDRHIVVPFDLPNQKNYLDETTYITNTYSEGLVFEEIAKRFGFNGLDAGKVMGMSSYGEKDESIPSIYKNGLINNDVFWFENDFTQTMVGLEETNNFQKRANIAYAIQTQIQNSVIEYILSMIEKTGQKNVCLSGGFFLNCVANYEIIKNIPEGINIYVEPNSTDAGTAIGAAKFLYHTLTESEEILPQTNLYYGPIHTVDVEKIKENKHMIVSPDFVAQLLSEKNIVAIYQGGSESGPRALGNRSILYDPRDPNGKDHVNTVKNREWFRPFAGTVLEEHSHDWFEMKSLKDSKFMMYAVDIKNGKENIIPAISHVDNTCRIQTLSKQDNKVFYEIIDSFYNITGVPVVFNTSFNLAGNCIVETPDDAIQTFYDSDIDFLYFAEYNILLTK